MGEPWIDMLGQIDVPQSGARSGWERGPQLAHRAFAGNLRCLGNGWLVDEIGSTASRNYPGEDVRSVVLDDDRRTPERVRLSVEANERSVVEFYVTELIRACERVVSPFVWDRDRNTQFLRGDERPPWMRWRDHDARDSHAYERGKLRQR